MKPVKQLNNDEIRELFALYRSIFMRELFTEVERKYTGEWKACKSPERREQIWNAIQGLLAVKAEMNHYIDEICREDERWRNLKLKDELK